MHLYASDPSTARHTVRHQGFAPLPRHALAGLALLAAAGAVHPGAAFAGADLGSSVKCFDSGPSPCVSFALKDPPDPVRYALRYVNTGDEPAVNVRFRDNLNNLGSACGGALDPDPLRPPTCVADPATCGGNTCTDVKITGGVFTADLAVMPVGCIVDLVVDTFVRQGSAGTCCNEGEVTWDDSVGNRKFVTGQVCFNAGLPNVVISQALDPPGQAPQPGDAVTFRITITNQNPTATMDQGTMTDTLDAQGCLTVTDVSQVTCDPPSSCGACNLSASGFVHDYKALAPGSSVSFLVTALVDPAVATPVTCTNTAETSDPDPFLEIATASVVIQSPGCSLLSAAATFPPLDPPRVGAWLYTRPCSLGGDGVLEGVIGIAAEGDLADSFAGNGGGLALYQVDCGANCPQRIALDKNRATGSLRMSFLP